MIKNLLKEFINETSDELVNAVSIARKRNAIKAHDDVRHLDDIITAEKIDVAKKYIGRLDKQAEQDSEIAKINAKYDDILKDLIDKSIEADKKLERNKELVAKRNARLNKNETLHSEKVALYNAPENELYELSAKIEKSTFNGKYYINFFDDENGEGNLISRQGGYETEKEAKDAMKRLRPDYKLVELLEEPSLNAGHLLKKFVKISEDYDASTFQFCIRTGDSLTLLKLIDEQFVKYQEAKTKEEKHAVELAVNDMLNRFCSSGTDELDEETFNKLFDRLHSLEQRIIDDNTAEWNNEETAQKERLKKLLAKNESLNEISNDTIKSALYKQAKKGVKTYFDSDDTDAWFDWHSKFKKNVNNYKRLYADALKSKTTAEKEAFMKQYRRNEDGNYHMENLLLTAEYVGDKELIKATKALVNKYNKQGYYANGDDISRAKMELGYILDPIFDSVYDDLNKAKNESEEKREVLPIKFVRVDEWNRPIFKPEGKKYYLSDVNNLFSEGDTEEKIKDFYAKLNCPLRDCITFHGYSIDSEPMGDPLKFDLEIV